MTEITREQIEAWRDLSSGFESVKVKSWFFKDLCALALKSLEQPTPSQDTVEAVARALDRQCDNMAFILNHVGLPEQYFFKFKRELEQDRLAIAAYEERRK